MIRWEDIFSHEALLIATTQVYTKCLFQRKKCYTESFDEKTLFDWARHNKANNIRLRNHLSSQNFVYSPMRKTTIKFPNKTRDIYIATWRDRIVDSMLNTELNRKMDINFSDDSYAYRLRNSGVDICQTKIANSLRRFKDGPIYIVKRDIKNYYPSIDKEILLKQVERYIADDYLLSLIKRRIFYNAIDKDGNNIKNDSGIPFGSPLSCFLANIYLNDLDHKIKIVPVDYFRYADDF